MKSKRTNVKFTDDEAYNELLYILKVTGLYSTVIHDWPVDCDSLEAR